MASASTSTLSVQKTSSAGACVLNGKNEEVRRKSCDTVCSSNSSCFLRKRKPMNPLAGSVRPYVTRSSGNVVKQRVMSAKLLKLRSIQSELNDANFHLMELAKENRALKALQRRQDKALSNYEGVNAELPRLIKSHEEEIRVLQEKNKILRKHLKEVSEQLKVKDEELIHVKEKLARLSALSKDKHLPEREKLVEQVEELKDVLNKSESKISMLNRKLMLEQKNAKFKVNNETHKAKQVQRDLSQALCEIDRLNALLDARGKFISANCRSKRTPGINSVSLVALNPTKQTINPAEPCTESVSMTNIKEEPIEIKTESTSDLKLEPIASNSSSNLSINKEERESTPPIANGIMTSPLENIKARLSAGSKKHQNQDINETKIKLGMLNLSDTDLLDIQQIKTPNYTNHNNKSRPNSSQKLEKLNDTIHKVMCKDQEEIGEAIGAYANQIVSSVRTSNLVVSKHNETLENAKNATDDILNKLKETDFVDKKIRTNKILKKEEFEIPERDMDLVNKIWKDEYSFQKTANRNSHAIKKYDFLSKSMDKNGNTLNRELEVPVENKNRLLEKLKSIDKDEENEKMVPVEHKRKLLATLRAIDNGESIESNDGDIKDNSSRRFHIMEELFGKI